MKKNYINNKFRTLGAMFGLSVPMVLVACGVKNNNKIPNSTPEDTNIPESNDNVTTPDIDVTDIEFKEDDLYQSYSEIDLINVLSSDFVNDEYTIIEAGAYYFTGNYNGTIFVNADKKDVRIIFDNVILTAIQGSAIAVDKAKRVEISFVPQSENTISDSETYNYPADGRFAKANAAIYSKKNLVINGTGKVKLNGNYNHGIKANDTLKINETTIAISAIKDGITVNDGLAIRDSNIKIKSNGDGIQCENDDDDKLGYIIIESGTFEIDAQSDGIQAGVLLKISAGTFDIKTGGGSSANLASDVSAKGLKSNNAIELFGGNFELNAADDAIHSDGYIKIENGDYTISTGDDAIRAESKIVILDGNINITKSYEGIESKVIYIEGGIITVNSSDDGINAVDPSGKSLESNQIIINGGTLIVNADGDPLDSNGSIYLNSGIVLLSGNANSRGESIIDFDIQMVIKGGTLIATGGTENAHKISNNSTQPSLHAAMSSTFSAKTPIVIKKQSGEIIGAYVPTKSYKGFVISSPLMKLGDEIIVETGGNLTGVASNGYYSSATHQGGTQQVKATLSSVATTSNIGSSSGANKPTRP